MNANQLIGKLALRTKPVTYASGVKDYSYTDEPVRILAVTEGHIVYQSTSLCLDRDKKRIMDIKWIDDNWTSYDDLVSLVIDGRV